MKFEQAFLILKAGEKIRLPHWDDGVFISLSDDKFSLDSDDIFSEDWEVVDVK